MLHHLMVGTWTPPGAIFTFEFDDEKRSLKLVKKTNIPKDEPISWMTFDVSPRRGFVFLYFNSLELSIYSMPKKPYMALQ